MRTFGVTLLCLMASILGCAGAHRISCMHMALKGDNIKYQGYGPANGDMAYDSVMCLGACSKVNAEKYCSTLQNKVITNGTN